MIRIVDWPEGQRLKKLIFSYDTLRKGQLIKVIDGQAARIVRVGEYIGKKYYRIDNYEEKTDEK